MPKRKLLMLKIRKLVKTQSDSVEKIKFSFDFIIPTNKTTTYSLIISLLFIGLLLTLNI